MHAGHDHGASQANAAALTKALALTATFLIVEVIGGFVTGSLALISDAAHMFTDTMALAIALAAIRVGQFPADTKRTFGYKRFEILAAACNAILLFIVAIYILYEAYQRIMHPVPIASIGMLSIAAVGLVVNLISMRILSEGKDASLNVKGAYLEVWSDMLGSVGVIFAALAIWLTGWTWIDAVVAVAIGLWILPRTWTLLRETLNILLEGVPQGLDIRAIAKAIESIPGVVSLHDLHVWALTSDMPSLSVHILIDPAENGDAVRKLVEQRLAERFDIHHVTIQTERSNCRADRPDHGSHDWPAAARPHHRHSH